MTHLNVLTSVREYKDLPAAPSVNDFTFVEGPMMAMYYTINGWVFFEIQEQFELIFMR